MKSKHRRYKLVNVIKIVVMDLEKKNEFSLNVTEASNQEVGDMESLDNNPGVPLQTSWTFWLDEAISGTTSEQFKEHLKKIYKVYTVQGFWSVFNNIPKADEMKVRYSYHLMRSDRFPIWEERENQNGGTWRFKCDKKDTARVWQEVILAAIGEQFSEMMPEGDDIVGVTVNVRENDDVIQIWNINAALASKATIQNKVHSLVPDVIFPHEFYKPHQKHYAYGRS